MGKSKRIEVNCRICKSFLHTTEEHEFMELLRKNIEKEAEIDIDREVKPFSKADIKYGLILKEGIDKERLTELLRAFYIDINSARENSEEIAMKKGLGLIELGEVNRKLKKYFGKLEGVWAK